MKLFDFPFLVQENILKQMHFGYVFFISLCSKRSIKLIQRVGWRHLKEIEYYSSSMGQVICMFVYLINKQNSEIDGLGLYLNDEIAAETSRVSIFGKNVRCRFPDQSSPELVSQLDKEDKWFLVMMKNQLDVLFGKGLPTETKKDSCRGGIFLPKNLEFGRRCMITHSEETEAQDFEDYFDAIGNQDFVEMLHRGFNRPINTNSKFFSTNILVVKSSNKDAIYMLENFKGEEAVFSADNFRSGNIIGLLKKWKKREYNNNLEKLQINTRLNPRLVFEEYARELNIKRLPNSIAPPIVQLTQNFYRTYKQLDPLEVTIPTYITRDDGIVGLLSVTPEKLVFSVKRITEKEMLETNSIA
ncbi:unnamed protein product [Caenorhabditis brenneri]